MKDYELGPLILNYYDKFDGMWIQCGLIFLLTIFMIVIVKTGRANCLSLLVSGFIAVFVFILIPINLLYMLFAVHNIDNFLEACLISMLYLSIMNIIFIMFGYSESNKTFQP